MQKVNAFHLFLLKCRRGVRNQTQSKMLTLAEPWAGHRPPPLHVQHSYEFYTRLTVCRRHSSPLWKGTRRFDLRRSGRSDWLKRHLFLF